MTSAKLCVSRQTSSKARYVRLQWRGALFRCSFSPQASTFSFFVLPKIRPIRFQTILRTTLLQRLTALRVGWLAAQQLPLLRQNLVAHKFGKQVCFHFGCGLKVQLDVAGLDAAAYAEDLVHQGLGTPL